MDIIGYNWVETDHNIQFSSIVEAPRSQKDPLLSSSESRGQKFNQKVIPPLYQIQRRSK